MCVGSRLSGVYASRGRPSAPPPLSPLWCTVISIGGGLVTQIPRPAGNPHAVDAVPVQHELLPKDQLLVRAVEVIGGGACSRTPTCTPAAPMTALRGTSHPPFVFVFVCSGSFVSNGAELADNSTLQTKTICPTYACTTPGTCTCSVSVQTRGPPHAYETTYPTPVPRTPQLELPAPGAPPTAHAPCDVRIGRPERAAGGARRHAALRTYALFLVRTPAYTNQPSHEKNGRHELSRGGADTV